MGSSHDVDRYERSGRGEFDADPLNGYEQYGRRLELTNKYANGAGADWRKELADYASLLKSKGEIKPDCRKRLLLSSIKR